MEVGEPAVAWGELSDDALGPPPEVYDPTAGAARRSASVTSCSVAVDVEVVGPDASATLRISQKTATRSGSDDLVGWPKVLAFDVAAR